MDDDDELVEAEGKALQAKRQDAGQQERDDFRGVLSSRVGRRFVWRLLEDAGPYRGSFHTDAGVMAYNEGRRAMGAKLVEQLVDEHFEAYIQMQKEHQEDIEHG